MDPRLRGDDGNSEPVKAGDPRGSGGPAAKGLAPRILLRGQATAPTKQVLAQSPGGSRGPFGDCNSCGSGGPAAKGLAPRILLRGQATAPTKPVPDRSRATLNAARESCFFV